MTLITTAMAMLLVLVLIADLFALYFFTTNREMPAHLISIDNHLGAIERHLAGINDKGAIANGPVSDRVASSVSDRANVR